MDGCMRRDPGCVYEHSGPDSGQYRHSAPPDRIWGRYSLCPVGGNRLPIDTGSNNTSRSIYGQYSGHQTHLYHFVACIYCRIAALWSLMELADADLFPRRTGSGRRGAATAIDDIALP